MTQINPFTGAIIVGAQVQQSQGAEKQRHIRRIQNLSKNAALNGDELDHQVESSDAVQATHDQQAQGGQDRERQPEDQGGDEDRPHIDLTA